MSARDLPEDVGMMKMAIMLLAGVVLMTAFFAPVARSDYYPDGDLITPGREYTYNVDQGSPDFTDDHCYYIKVEAYDNLSFHLNSVQPSNRSVQAYFFTNTKAVSYRADKELAVHDTPANNWMAYDAYYYTQDMKSRPLSIIASSYDLVLVMVVFQDGYEPGNLTFNLTERSTVDSVPSLVDSLLNTTKASMASDLNGVYLNDQKDIHDLQNDTNQTLDSLNMTMHQQSLASALNESALASRIDALSGQLNALKANDTAQKKEIEDLKAAGSAAGNGVAAGAVAGIAAGAVAGVAGAFALGRKRPA